MYRAMLLAAILVPVSSASAQGVGDIVEAINNRNFKSSNAPRPLIDIKGAIGCPSGADGEVVVCGSPKPKYGPDAAVMDAADAPSPPPSADRRETVNVESCGVGTNLCDSGQIPVSAIALAGAKAVIQALKGEDWKEVFRTRPDEYQRYLDARNRRQARARVSVGVGAGARQ